MTTTSAVLAEALLDLPDAPPEVQQQISTELLYALGLIQRPGLDDDGEA